MKKNPLSKEKIAATRAEFAKAVFQERALRNLERELRLPPGWWALSYKDVFGPDGQRVHFSGGLWTVALHGTRVSRHDSREAAIKRAHSVRSIL